MFDSCSAVQRIFSFRGNGVASCLIKQPRVSIKAWLFVPIDSYIIVQWVKYSFSWLLLLLYLISNAFSDSKWRLHVFVLRSWQLRFLCVGFHENRPDFGFKGSQQWPWFFLSVSGFFMSTQIRKHGSMLSRKFCCLRRRKWNGRIEKPFQSYQTDSFSHYQMCIYDCALQ